MKGLVGLLSAVMLSSASAQDAKVDLEARKRSIPVIEKHIQERQERVDAIGADLTKLNQRIEKTIDAIVTKLSGMKDSEESKFRVGDLKMRAMKGLGKSIGRYQYKRNQLLEAIREKKTDIPIETLEKDAKIFDEHIAKRVDQILTLSKSFMQEEDVEKYEVVDGGSYYNGWGWSDEVEQISEEWRQNRRNRVKDTKQHREVMEALESSIKREEARVKTLEGLVADKKLTGVDRRVLEGELKRHKALLDQRKDQFAEMSEVAQPDTAETSREDALDFESSVNDAAEDLRRDLNQLFVQYDDLNRERQKVAGLTKNLEERKKWLKENGGK